MLPASRRVSRVLFEKTMATRQTFHGAHFSVKIGSEANDAPSRFSFVVSKKILQRATKRNALRRKAYEAIRTVQDQVKSGFVILIFAKKTSIELTRDMFTQELVALFQKAGILK